MPSGLEPERESLSVKLVGVGIERSHYWISQARILAVPAGDLAAVLFHNLATPRVLRSKGGPPVVGLTVVQKHKPRLVALPRRIGPVVPR